jgi:hypothetical protein
VLQDRLKRTKEKLFMLSSLQEISRNVDTIALALPHAVPDMHGLDKVRAMCAAAARLLTPQGYIYTYSAVESYGSLDVLCGLQEIEWPGYSPKALYDVTYNFGNKDIFESNGMRRMRVWVCLLYTSMPRAYAWSQCALLRSRVCK